LPFEDLSSHFIANVAAAFVFLVVIPEGDLLCLCFVVVIAEGDVLSHSNSLQSAQLRSAYDKAAPKPEDRQTVMPAPQPSSE